MCFIQSSEWKEELESLGQSENRTKSIRLGRNIHALTKQSWEKQSDSIWGYASSSGKVTEKTTKL